ncbi:hypothetical protein CALVIDRAFT_596625 [Calocera viscosa TUFC12733]|uniref:ABM domain-containing protein n=1 Tax=Calocera viscosa (strain TUFC12733) TaxID=1330018 RepID=A0A167P7W5_CALVF|nr:hypothetical protein CALVIDRAFT_596625 [Calocera viscosa TUFC12733]
MKPLHRQQVAKPGKIDQLIKELKTLKASADGDAEPGTLRFDILRAGDKICVVEKYTNAAAIYVHVGTQAFKDYQDRVGGLIVEGSESSVFWDSA